jgi:gas vesicle protein
MTNKGSSNNLPQVYYVDSNRTIYGEEETVNMKDFIIGALVGGIVGAAAGLLLAPKAGHELRGDVATQAVNLKDKSVEFSSTAKEKTTQLVDKVKSKSSKTPTVFDDGTVSSEGEEPLDEASVGDMTDGMEEAAVNRHTEEGLLDDALEGNAISNSARPSSI